MAHAVHDVRVRGFVFIYVCLHDIGLRLSGAKHDDADGIFEVPPTTNDGE